MDISIVYFGHEVKSLCQTTRNQLSNRFTMVSRWNNPGLSSSIGNDYRHRARSGATCLWESSDLCACLFVRASRKFGTTSGTVEPVLYRSRLSGGTGGQRNCFRGQRQPPEITQSLERYEHYTGRGGASRSTDALWF